MLKQQQGASIYGLQDRDCAKQDHVSRQVYVDFAFPLHFYECWKVNVSVHIGIIVFGV